MSGYFIALCRLIIVLGVMNALLQRAAIGELKEILSKEKEDNRKLVDAILRIKGEAPVFVEEAEPLPTGEWFQSKKDSADLTS